MKILFTILFSFLISIYTIGCDSSNSSTNSSNCPINQSIGCDSNCAENPLQNDTCGVCGGNGSSCEGLLNVYYDVDDVPIAGFQFDVDGVAVISASGGAAMAAGFSVSSSSTTVLGFSLSGSVIPQGTGTLISLEIEGDSNSFCIQEDEGLVLSNIGGETIPVIIENCNKIKSSE
jgi:hypothetical protein